MKVLAVIIIEENFSPLSLTFGILDGQSSEGLTYETYFLKPYDQNRHMKYNQLQEYCTFQFKDIVEKINKLYVDEGIEGLIVTSKYRSYFKDCNFIDIPRLEEVTTAQECISIPWHNVLHCSKCLYQKCISIMFYKLNG